MVVEEEEAVRAVKNSTPCFYRMLREGGAHQNVNKDSPLLMIVEGLSIDMVNDCPPSALRAFDLFV